MVTVYDISHLDYLVKEVINRKFLVFCVVVMCRYLVHHTHTRDDDLERTIEEQERLDAKQMEVYGSNNWKMAVIGWLM